MFRVLFVAHRRSSRAGLAGVLLLWASMSLAQDVTEVALKAAFIYNFAKFTEWPREVLPAAAPLMACVLGDLAVGDALERTVKDRMVNGHGIGVVRVTADKPMTACHLLYLTGVSPKEAIQIAVDLRGAPVLTISDAEEFARLGGIAQFFVENGKMRFGINLGSAKRARLQLSSKLLALAELVEDESNKARHSSPFGETAAEAWSRISAAAGAPGSQTAHVETSSITELKHE